MFDHRALDGARAVGGREALDRDDVRSVKLMNGTDAGRRRDVSDRFAFRPADEHAAGVKYRSRKTSTLRCAIAWDSFWCLRLYFILDFRSEKLRSTWIMFLFRPEGTRRWLCGSIHSCLWTMETELQFRRYFPRPE